MLYLILNNALFALRLSTFNQKVLRKLIFYIAIIFLFVFSAFRFEVGCDWASYFTQYKIADASDFMGPSIGLEPIWWALLLGITKIGWGYHAVNIISSGLFFLGIFALGRRQPDPLGFLVLLFPVLIINMPMSGIRQGAAIGLICLAFLAFIDKKPITYILWVLIASGFHTSAILFLCLVPFARGKYSLKRFALTIVLSTPGLFLMVLTSTVQELVGRYIGTNVEAAGAIFRVGVMSLTGVYFFLFLRKKWQRLFLDDYLIVTLGALGMILALCVIGLSSVIADRFVYYLIPIQAMIFSRIPFLPFRENGPLHVLLPYIALSFMFIVWTQTSIHFEKCYLPYKNWVFEK